MLRPWLPVALVTLCLLACGNDRGDGLTDDVDGGVDADDLPGQAGGLPCDVQTFLAQCQTCHGTKPANGAPMSLVSYRDLTARNRDGILIADRVLARIMSTSSPMPPEPSPAVAAPDIATFQAWLDRGMPASECVAAPGPFDGPVVCTSGQTWTRGDDESPLMHPGRACIACHVSEDDDDAPRFTIAGTVYPTGHEPNDCHGATAAIVEVTDATSRVLMLPVNATGNFFTTSRVTFPIHVAVLAGGKRRMMGGSPPRGDCNSCHTQDGANDAPGRIVLP